MGSMREIANRRREEWRARAGDQSFVDAIARSLQSAPATRLLSEAISEDALQLIVEPKRATVARGVIHDGLDVAAIAAECEAGGAAAISVVTEPVLSSGSIDDLRVARAACSLPIIARDVVVHCMQVHELRAAGADAVLLSVEPFVDEDDLVGVERLDVIVHEIQRLGMDAVLGVGTPDELAVALATDLDVLNIDNREPDGRIDVDRTLDLLAEVPVGTPVLSESIARVEEVARLHRAGVDALLLDEGHAEHGLTSALKVYSDLAIG